MMNSFSDHEEAYDKLQNQGEGQEPRPSPENPSMALASESVIVFNHIKKANVPLCVGLPSPV